MANPVLQNGVASPQSAYEVSNVQHHAVGTRGELGDRSFRYGLHIQGTALAVGNLVAAAAPIAAHITQTGAVTSAPGGVAPAPAGTTAITLALGATVGGQDMYKDGYLKIQSSTLGLGQIMKLRNFPYTAASGTTGTIDLYDPIVTTPTGTVTWSLVHNPYAYVIQAPVTTKVSMAVGVNLVGFPATTTAAVATAGYLRTAATTWSLPNYGWFQTWGPCSVLMDTTDIVAGHGVVTSVVAAGSVGVAVENEIVQRVGVAMEALATNTVHGSVYLQIAP